MLDSKDTIAAIATAQGGALGIVRVSGDKAIETVDAIFRPAHDGLPLSRRKPYSLAYGHILLGDEILDDVLISIFKSPHSFTGEDSVEIACHGSRYILQKVLEILIQKGCRMADPGEFTKRAFLNGKMDLSQAEAVADLIASTSRSSHRLALSQMRGGFSRELATLRDKLLEFTSLMELELDFSDHEDVEFADRSQMKQLIQEIKALLSKLTESFSVGNAIKNGVPVAIIGKTNAGKSTLLNALLKEEKAIVSDINGTTRDAIEDTCVVDGILFRFIDTAGIRNTDDVIERMGIERTFAKIREASIVIWMLDATCLMSQIEELWDQIMEACHDKQLILAINKEDIEPGCTISKPLPQDAKVIRLSARQGTHLPELQKALIQSAAIPEISQSDVIVTNARHYEALSKALDAILRAEEGLEAGLSGDFISQDSRECIHHLSDIIGEVTTSDVLENIFKNFCIGK